MWVILCVMLYAKLHNAAASALLFGLIAASSHAQNETLSDWPKLIEAKQCDQARKLCTAYVYATDMNGQTDSQKCLASVALCSATPGAYQPKAVDEALAHINRGLELAPQDLTMHQARLHILQITGRYADIPQALDDTCTIYKGNDAMHGWLMYAGELQDLHQYKVGLAFVQVLDKHYPNQPDVLSDIGQFLVLLGRNNDAIPYFQKAVALAPKDSYNVWALARAYDTANQIDLASKFYKSALLLIKNADQLRDSTCSYGQFVETKLHDRGRACSLEKMGCDADAQTACARNAPNTPASVSASQNK